MEYAALVGRLRTLLPPPSAMPQSGNSSSSSALQTNSRSDEVSDGSVPAVYCCASAPLAMLRIYAAQKKWLSLKDGHVIFEDDLVEFPCGTLTPVREQPASDSAPLSLASLWMLVCLG